jgi:hypothetical protein
MDGVMSMLCSEYCSYPKEVAAGDYLRLNNLSQQRLVQH